MLQGMSVTCLIILSLPRISFLTIIEWLKGKAPDPAVDPPISAFFNTALSLRGEDALMAVFDPELSILVFDPFMNNQFNAFDMSDWVKDEDEAL